MPAALWDAGNRAHAPAGVGHLRANVRGTAIILTLATRQTPTITDTLLSAAKLVDDYGMRIILQSDAQGGSHIMTKEGVRIPIARDQRRLFGLDLRQLEPAPPEAHSGNGETTLEAYQPSEIAKDGPNDGTRDAIMRRALLLAVTLPVTAAYGGTAF